MLRSAASSRGRMCHAPPPRELERTGPFVLVRTSDLEGLGLSFAMAVLYLNSNGFGTRNANSKAGWPLEEHPAPDSFTRMKLDASCLEIESVVREIQARAISQITIVHPKEVRRIERPNVGKPGPFVIHIDIKNVAVNLRRCRTIVDNLQNDRVSYWGETLTDLRVIHVDERTWIGEDH